MKSLYLVFSFTTLAIYGNAQSFYNNGAMVSIKTNTLFSIGDSLVNNGEIINNGNILVRGTWINYRNYDAGQGQITFTSDQQQVINHNDQSFSKLTISGGGEKLFLANITIENELNLQSGVLTAQNGARIIVSPTAQLSGGSDQSHIHGPVYHEGSGNKFFPVGDGQTYTPVELLNIHGASAQVGIRVVPVTSGTLLKSEELNAISDKRYWEIDATAGALTNSRIVLPVRNESIVSIAGHVVVAQSAGLSQPFESLGQGEFTGTVQNGRVTSSLAVSRPLVAIATVPEVSNDQSITVYNAISPNGDGLNDFLIIENIQHYPGNVVSIYNRWGDKVFEMKNYDNQQKVFRGKSNINGERDLPAATYFYAIDKNDGSKKITGYLSLKVSGN
jgi:gliding motility-associated-like protein